MHHAAVCRDEEEAEHVAELLPWPSWADLVSGGWGGGGGGQGVGERRREGERKEGVEGRREKRWDGGRETGRRGRMFVSEMVGELVSV